MSSGKIEQNYFTNIQDGSLFNDYDHHSEYFLHESHNSESKTNKKQFYNSIQMKMQDRFKGVIDNHFNIIQKIHYILKNSQDLTQKQKFDYCNNQRFFMKLYLKSISERI